MGLKNQIIESIVKPVENSHYDLTQGEIIYYDEKTNKAKVQIRDPRGGGSMALENVPVQLGSGGVHSAGPFQGDIVWVSFQNRNPLFPKIISLADRNYQVNTRERFSHGEKGGYVTDLEDVEIKEILPVEEAWTSRSTIQDLSYYMESDPYADLQENIENVKYYASAEVGMTHPENGSTIKISDDGTISIFTGLGEGIRVSPKNHSVSIFSGNTNTNEGDVTNRMNNWTIHCEDEVKINAKGSISLNSEEFMIFQAKEFVFKDKDGKRTNLQEAE